VSAAFKEQTRQCADKDRNCGCISLMDQWEASKKLRRQLLEAFPPEITRSFPEE
jgi:hypothetical protein